MTLIHLTLPHNDGQGWVRLMKPWSTDPPNQFTISLCDKSEASDIHIDDLEKVKRQIRNQVPGTVITEI